MGEEEGGLHWEEEEEEEEEMVVVVVGGVGLDISVFIIGRINVHRPLHTEGMK